MIFIKLNRYNSIVNILLIFLFSSAECFSPDLTNKDRNYSRAALKPLFDENLFWVSGDIPILNRKVFKGMRVTIREHPYIASVRRDLAHYCVATMLTKNVFVTVAHPLIECSVKSIQLVHPSIPLNRARAFVTGWGRCDRTGRELCLPRSTKFTPGEKLDPMLRTVSFIIKLPNYYCEGYKQNGVNFSPGMMCLGQAREEDKMAPCLAAPGAPLVVEAHLAGLLSWGYGCGYDNDLPLVYTNIQHHQPWFLHNIPILRRITHSNLTILFEAERAFVMSMWLAMTRIHPPPPLTVLDKPLEMLKLDRELAKLRGKVYDLRDYLFNGIQHLYKVRLYEILRQRILERQFLIKIRNEAIKMSPEPFLNLSFDSEPEIMQQMKIHEKPRVLEEPEVTDTESDNSYGD
ncbi:uncharacterized protein LOC113493957 isoform X2 [Trichoplusia ni]|uniref:Uncharacterized protein LOC113493957 isoform X2 n=1 Tax=Trichoplusia ni TaxID=7111 RepID=A0A7E5VHK8_TRINI|nr:uncharacterized protein LOC113493957 isoform X2 [Trichoplusia ni]